MKPVHSPFSFPSPMTSLMDSLRPRVAAVGIVPKMDAKDGAFLFGTSPSSWFSSSSSGLFCSSLMSASSVSSPISLPKCLATACSSSSSSGSSSSILDDVEMISSMSSTQSVGGEDRAWRKVNVPFNWSHEGSSYFVCNNYDTTGGQNQPHQICQTHHAGRHAQETEAWNLIFYKHLQLLNQNRVIQQVLT